MRKLSNISLYWKCQFTGWSVAALYWGYLGFTAKDFNLPLGIIYFITDVLIYIFITHLYRLFSKKHNWDKLPIQKLLLRLVPSIFVLGISYTLLTLGKLYTASFFFDNNFTQTFAQFAEANRVTVFVGGTRLMSIWALAYYLYHYAQREINTVKENAHLSIIAKDAQLNNLSAQLNPHFLFNSLNNIKSLVLEDPQLARRAIDLLSDLLRSSLYGREGMLISIKDELSLVNDYLELEKLRFEERLQFTIDVPDQLLSSLIIPFSIQALAENAVKHGINKQTDGGVIEISITQSKGFIVIAVQSPGRLESNKQPHGLGLKNLKERLKLQFNNKGGFSICEQQNETVLATILIPAA